MRCHPRTVPSVPTKEGNIPGKGTSGDSSPTTEAYNLQYRYSTIQSLCTLRQSKVSSTVLSGPLYFSLCTASREKPGRAGMECALQALGVGSSLTPDRHKNPGPEADTRGPRSKPQGPCEPTSQGLGSAGAHMEAHTARGGEGRGVRWGDPAVCALLPVSTSAYDGCHGVRLRALTEQRETGQARHLHAHSLGRSTVASHSLCVEHQILPFTPPSVPPLPPPARLSRKRPLQGPGTESTISTPLALAPSRNAGVSPGVSTSRRVRVGAGPHELLHALRRRRGCTP